MSVHLLALETSSSVCDVVVLSSSDGRVRRHALSHDGSGQHAERLLPMVDELLKQAGIKRTDLSVVAFGQGPGGFTGLRVACGVAQGMAFGLDLPVVAVPSLLAVAWRAHQRASESLTSSAPYYIVVQDARMAEVYLAVYRPPAEQALAWQVVQAPILIDAAQVAPWLKQAVAGWGLSDGTPAWLTGDALDAIPDLAARVQTIAHIHAGQALRADADAVAALALDAWHRGDTIQSDQARPLYVRDKVAFTTAERSLGAGGNPRAPAYGITLHTMLPEHLDAVAAIENRVQSFPWTRRNFADGLAAGYPAWVACQGDHVVGFYMVMMAPDVAHLLVIGVDPLFQGKGTGRLLLQHCESQALTNGLDTVVLEVRFSNEQAIGFYQHLGYQGFTVRKAYYPASHGTREDACVMKKTLHRGGGVAHG